MNIRGYGNASPQRKGEDTSAIEKAIETALINETTLPVEMTADDQEWAAEFTEIVKAWSDEAILVELLTIEWLVRRGYTIS